MSMPESNFPGQPGGVPPFGNLSTPPGSFPGAMPPSVSSGKKSKKAKKTKAPKTPKGGRGGGGVATRRSVRVQMLLAVAFAFVAAAGVAAYFQAKPAHMYVVRVNGPLAALAGTSQIDAQLQAVGVTGTVVDGAFTGSTASAALSAAKAYANGHVLTIPAFANAELSTKNFSSNSTGASAGQALVSIAVSNQNAVGGTLQVGNIVNVISTGSSTPLATSIKIVAIQPASSSAVYILAADPATAAAIAGASSGTLCLTYVQG